MGRMAASGKLHRSDWQNCRGRLRAESVDQAPNKTRIGTPQGRFEALFFEAALRTDAGNAFSEGVVSLKLEAAAANYNIDAGLFG